MTPAGERDTLCPASVDAPVRESRMLTGAQVKQIRKLRADGRTCAYVAAVVGCSRSAVRKIAPGYVGKVPVAPLREAFLRSGKSAAEVALAVGWRCSNTTRQPYADSSRVKRTLGLLDDVSGSGHRTRRVLIDAETAGLLAEAVGVMPWEVMPDDEEMAA